MEDPRHGFNTATLDDIATWGEDFGSTLTSLVDKYGAVLVQGLPLSEGAGFSKLMDGLGKELMPYLAGSGVRQRVNKGVDTASDEPPAFNIEPQNEMSYNTLKHPQMVRC